MIIRTLIFVLFATLAASSFAQTRYITDVVYVPMRSGPGNQYRIIHSAIKTGTQMSVIEEPEGSDWAHVKTAGGLEGWIRKQYLINEPPAQIKLNSAVKDLRDATERANSLQQELTALKQQYGSLNREAGQTETEREQLAEELKNLKALSADTININRRYEQLLADHDMMQTELDAVRADNDRLESDKTINQWLFGAGLVVLGMFLMLVLPRLKPKKRSTEWAN